MNIKFLVTLLVACVLVAPAAVTAAKADDAFATALEMQTQYVVDMQRLNVLGGSVTAGNKVTLNFRDAAIPGNKVSITYTVVAGDTLTTIATALKNAVNANANLMGHVTATSAGAVITLTSVSGLTD